MKVAVLAVLRATLEYTQMMKAAKLTMNRVIGWVIVLAALRVGSSRSRKLVPVEWAAKRKWYSQRMSSHTKESSGFSAAQWYIFSLLCFTNTKFCTPIECTNFFIKTTEISPTLSD
jgi:hypothetical protein